MRTDRRTFLRTVATGTLATLTPAPLVRTQQVFEGADGLPAIVEDVYARGMRYLRESQRADGVWASSAYCGQTGVMGMAIVSLLAHGDNPNWGPYGSTIQAALSSILNRMDDKTGYIGTSMYNHGFATLALAEAYGEVDNPRLGPALKRAVELILAAQEQNPRGAWRYSPSSKDADTTVTGAQMVALFAARNAGIPVPETAIQKGLKFFLDCQTPDGGIGYTSSSAPNAPRTAIACLILNLAKETNSKPYALALDFLRKQPLEQTSYQFYYLYYASQAFFRASPQDWSRWNQANIQRLATEQKDDGRWDGQFGPTFSTSAALLSLALNYRYLPIYER